MGTIRTLLTPRFLSARNRTDVNLLKILLFGSIGIILWGGLFGISWRLLIYFKSIEELGNILAWKLLSMVLIVYFSLLVFSSLLTALSKLYLSKDLLLVHSMPVASHKIFAARWIETAIDSAWMILIYTLPVLLAYNLVYSAGMPDFLFGLLVMAAVLLLLSLLASLLSAIAVMLTVIIIPPGRIKTIFIFLGLLLFILLYFAFRMIRPERLVDPEAFDSVMLYLKLLETPSSPFLPTTWAFDAIQGAFNGNLTDPVLNTALLFFATGLMVSLAVLVADMIYFKGVSKSQTARQPLRKPRDRFRKSRFSPFPRPVSAYLAKEVKTFFRDQTQWSQIFLILALIVIYLYNFKVLPLERSPIKTVYLQNLLSFLNMGLAAFVLTAITARFAFPAVSIEGGAFWLVRSSPISLKSFLWIKFFIYFVPLLILTELLIVATNLLLAVTPFMMALSVITILFVVPAVVALGIGLGAAFPDFNAENPAQSVTSFGGLVFMMISAAYIMAVVVLEAGPVYRIFMTGISESRLQLAEWLWIGVSFGLILLITMAAIFYPMKYGLDRLTRTT